MIDREAWIQEFENKKVAIWGWGMEGKSSYRFIRSLLPELVLYIIDKRKDTDQASVISSETTNTVFQYEDETDFNCFDIILKSPGIVVKEGIDLDKISGQAPLFLKHYKDRMIGVTGTKGKSTTTSLIAAVLNEKYKTHLVGNIGKACFDVIDEMKEEDLVAFEISCHQLEYAKDSPHISVYINLFEEHLDHYGSFEKYGHAKDEIFLHQSDDDILIIGKDIAERAKKENKILIGKDITVKDHVLMIPNKELVLKENPLVGSHNEMNIAVSYYIANLYGVSDDQFLHAIKNFQPLHHRLEYLGEKDGITYIDDSISTIGQSCIQALQAYPKTRTVLVGGMDRGIEYDELEEYLSKSDVQVIFMYNSGKRVYSEMKEKDLLREGLYVVEDLQEATNLAKKITPIGHACLLSPAASSYDHFKNFEERGDVFRKMVLE